MFFYEGGKDCVQSGMKSFVSLVFLLVNLREYLAIILNKVSLWLPRPHISDLCFYLVGIVWKVFQGTVQPCPSIVNLHSRVNLSLSL